MTDLSKLQVLIADDTADIRELLSLYLKRSGVRVLEAENGQQALDLALTKAPDLVLMDIEMPIMNGVEATRALRSQGYSGAILALTAHQDPEQSRIMHEAGCDGILEKPLSRRRLLQVLGEMTSNTVDRDLDPSPEEGSSRKDSRQDAKIAK